MYDPEQHHRRSIRIREVSYAEPGGYFVTICSHRHESLFGEVAAGEMRLNGLGEIVREEWERTGVVRANVELDAFVVMPNHVHGIVWVLPEDGSGDVQQDIVGATRWVALHPGLDKGEGRAAGQNGMADQNGMSVQNRMADQNRATHRVA
ncbi:MAG TPA: hypothetical protein VFG50_15640, partial [Rhodothermales bacterium]|nr:hypothetical protein [Rhodothermales bacterium]